MVRRHRGRRVLPLRNSSRPARRTTRTPRGRSIESTCASSGANQDDTVDGRARERIERPRQRGGTRGRYCFRTVAPMRLPTPPAGTTHQAAMLGRGAPRPPRAAGSTMKKVSPSRIIPSSDRARASRLSGLIFGPLPPQQRVLLGQATVLHPFRFNPSLQDATSARLPCRSRAGTGAQPERMRARR